MIAIRPLRSDERLQWEPLWLGYLAFYKTELAREVTDVTWARLHDPGEPMQVLGGYLNGTLQGIAHIIFHRSCWTIGNYCYLQDLFVAAQARGQGLGRALIEAVYATARQAEASRVYWLTHESNHAAMELYEKMADRSGFIQYRKLF